MPENTSATSVGPGVRRSDRLRWWVFAVVLAADLLDMIDATVTTIAAPVIVRDLAGSDALVPWLGLSYALALGSFLVVGGRLGDRFGQRRTFLIGLVGFTAASLLCGIAWTPAALVCFRLIQGAFGALLIPQGFSILLRTFPRDQLGRVFGLFGPLLAVGSIGGPVLAGLLIQADVLGTGWRFVFLVNGLIGTVLLIAGPRVLPRDTPDPAVRIDPLASAIVMLGLLGVMGGLIVGGESGWGLVPLTALVAGVVLIGCFAALQRSTARPLLAPSLFRVRSFVAGITVGTIYFAAVAGLLYVVSLHLQQGAGLTPFHAAAIMAPLSVGIIVTSFQVRDHIQRLGRRLVLAGTAITLVGVIGLLALILLAPDVPAVLAVPLLVTGLGMGCCFGSLFSTALGDVTEQQAGSASGTLNALQQIANATGAALVSTLFLTLVAESGDNTAATTSLIVIAAILALAAASTSLLPRHAAADHH
ncbi:drug resistance transporter, EmrB/QacA subfamily [Jiangella alba]|uniref:Drug resistance transporter, EmrB/QacA subfamily n=2 Tax=Jiangella alba TaxID=561176 RepID=A0A1H5P2T3_9ACTN|nr:drug resistance transporter, EmrB/QacA subfamily [Jiangella alba]